ncbi:hypothetical protein CN646_15955 [Bacillus wiedmannii]|nr:hypothetical protein CN646_15955 [Bacillus wiedmannii]
MLFSMYKLMSSNYYFNILGGGFVVLGGLMVVEVQVISKNNTLRLRKDSNNFLIHHPINLLYISKIQKSDTKMLCIVALLKRKNSALISQTHCLISTLILFYEKLLSRRTT